MTVETPIWDTYKEIIRKYDEQRRRKSLEISSVLHSMMKQKPHTALSPQARKHCMPM